MDTKFLEKLKCDDSLKYNLSLRSKNKPASKFEWSNPEEADGVPILARSKCTDADPNVKTTYNNFAVIQRTKAGYMAGDITRVYADDVQEDLKAKYKEFDNLNHFKSRLKKLCFSSTGWGNTFSLLYLDELKRPRFKQVNAWNAKVLYDDNDEPIKGFVYYTEKDGNQEIEYIYEYDKLNVTKYARKANSQAIEVVEQPTIHGFVGIPVIEWKNNDNIQGNSQIAVSLMDAFDRLMSDNITEWATFRQAYLMLKNAGLIGDEDRERLQKTGIFELSGDNSEVKFITKDINPEFVKFITSETWSGIWVVSSSVDPKALASLSNATAFQISQLYRNMEEDCKDTEMEWKVSLEYLDRLLQSYWNGLDTTAVGKYSTESITYDFVRSLPSDNMTWLKDIVQAGGKLPNKQILIEAGYPEQEAIALSDEALSEQYEEIGLETEI